MIWLTPRTNHRRPRKRKICGRHCVTSLRSRRSSLSWRELSLLVLSFSLFLSPIRSSHLPSSRLTIIYSHLINNARSPRFSLPNFFLLSLFSPVSLFLSLSRCVHVQITPHARQAFPCPRIVPGLFIVFTRSRDALAAPYARYVYFIYKYVNKLRLYSYIVQWRLACAQVIPDLPSRLPSDLANEKTLAAFSRRGNSELRFQQPCNCCKKFLLNDSSAFPACY